MSNPAASSAKRTLSKRDYLVKPTVVSHFVSKRKPLPERSKLDHPSRKSNTDLKHLEKKVETALKVDKSVSEDK